MGSIAPASRPMPMVAAVLAVALEVRAGLALIARTGTRIAALALAFFTLVASFFHAYWGVPAKQQMVQQLLLFKNIAITGGLLTLAAWDPGEWSLSAHRDRT